MAHGAAIRAAYVATRAAQVGDVVAYYNMSSVNCGPHRATVTAIGEYATRVDLQMNDGELKTNVDHRGATDTGRLWDWK